MDRIEWVLAKLQGTDVYPVVKSLFDACPCMDSLDKNLLTLVLSHVNRTDYPAVARVCKKWHAVSQTRGYWWRHIVEAQSQVVKDVIDPFIFRQATLKDKVAWMWNTEWLNVAHQYLMDRQEMHLTQDENWPEHTVIDRFITTTDGDEVTRMFHYRRSEYGPFRPFGNLEVFYLERSKFGLWHYRAAVNPDSGLVVKADYIRYESDDGKFFEGSAWRHNVDHYSPHGAGTWYFPDGTTLTGDNVAFDGKVHGTGVNQDGDEETWFDNVKNTKKRKLVYFCCLSRLISSQSR